MIIINDFVNSFPVQYLSLGILIVNIFQLRAMNKRNKNNGNVYEVTKVERTHIMEKQTLCAECAAKYRMNFPQFVLEQVSDNFYERSICGVCRKKRPCAEYEPRKKGA